MILFSTPGVKACAPARWPQKCLGVPSTCYLCRCARNSPICTVQMVAGPRIPVKLLLGCIHSAARRASILVCILSQALPMMTKGLLTAGLRPCRAQGKTLRLNLPFEVDCKESRAAHSPVTGNLRVSMPRLVPPPWMRSFSGDTSTSQKRCPAPPLRLFHGCSL